MPWPIWLVQALWAVAFSVVATLLTPGPKNDGAKPSEGRTPEANDGTIIRKIYGTVWVPDSQVLAWKPLPPEPIRKGGKK
jgi:hypothetical protein